MKSPPLVEDYSFGKITVDGRTYRRDLILFPDRVHENWRRENGHSLCMDDLEEILSTHPDLCVFGTGRYGRMQVPAHVVDSLATRGIAVIAEETNQACQIYNNRREDLRTVGAFHLTC